MRNQELAIFVTLFVCLAPMSAYAEQKVWRLGFLTPATAIAG